MFKRTLSLIICIIMLISTFVGTGISASANNEIADEILSQAQAEPTEEPIEEPSVSAPEIPTATADKNSSVVVPDTATATYSGKCGDNLTWSYDTYNKKLEISGTGEMYDYPPRYLVGSYYITTPWKNYIGEIQTLVIGSSVGSIGDYAFQSFTALKSVTIPNSVTSIGDDAFCDCTSLTKLTIGNSVKSICRSAFLDCSSLTSVAIPDSVEIIETNAFVGCAALTNISIGNSVSKIENLVFYNTAYYDNKSNWSNGVLYIGRYLIEGYPSGDYSVRNGTLAIADSALQNSYSLTSISIPPSVRNIGKDAFHFASNSYKLSAVHITDVAAWCNIKFENQDANPLRYAKNLYLNNKLVKDLKIPQTATNIQTYAFYNCSSLKSVDIPDSVTYIGKSAFSSCPSLVSVNLPGKIKEISDSIFSYCNSLRMVNIPNSVRIIGNYAFGGCRSLVSVTIPQPVDTIGDYAFNDCCSLESVTIPKSVITIGTGAFFNCTSLKKVSIGSKVESIDTYAFFNCTSLKNVTIPASVTNIAEDAFYRNKLNESHIHGELVILDITLKCYVNSYGASYAHNNGFEYVLICNHLFTKYIFDNNPLCLDETKTANCDNGCGTKDVIVLEGTGVGHSYKDYINDNNATCSKDATETALCIYGCGTTDTRTIPNTKTTHRFITYSLYESATCMSNRKEISYCDYSGCDVSTIRQIANSKVDCYYEYFDYTCDYTVYRCKYGCGSYDYKYKDNHYWHWYTDYPPTCFDDGYDVYICSICGTFDYVTIPATGNHYNQVINTIAPTCTDEGWTVRGCYSCGVFEISDTVPALGHNLIHIPEKAPTCTEAGQSEYKKCTRCSYEEGSNTEYPAIGHDIKVVEGKPPTCMEIGWDKYEICKNCDYSTYLEIVVAHSFTDYLFDNNATCTSDGTESAYCSYGCGTVDSRTVGGTMLEHSYTKEQIVVAPQCEEQGLALNLCVCGDSIEVTLPLLGHSFMNYTYNGDATCTADGTKTAVCDHEGCTLTDTMSARGTKLEHIFGEWTVVLEPTLESEGREEHYCTVCQHSETRSLPKLTYENSYTDVKESAWFYDAVSYAVSRGYMKGMSDTRFSPNSNITREQFVLILANIAGVDTDEYKNIDSGFADVKTGQWYSGAVTWAVQEGYVSGVSTAKFGRGQSINRAALARMLYNYADKNGIDTGGRADLSAFGDAKEFDKSGNAWMKEPVQWAVDSGIISGMTVNGVNCVNPKGTATRAQAARMLMQFDTIQ